MALTTATRPQSSARGVARVVWAVAGACWVVTVVAILSGADGLGHHDAVLGQSDTAWPWRISGFAAAWLVMIGAMMLPTTVPMLELFWTVSARRPRPARSRVAVVTAYLVTWTAFALVALAADAGVHMLVEYWSWLAARPGLVLGGTLVLVGTFQFSALKEACLAACRSPLSLLWEHYRRSIGGAWALGFRHALYCLGCCWALMLVMFATGAGNVLWMLLLTAVMVAEKTTAWGTRLVAPTGIAFIVAGLAIAGTTLLTPI